MEGRLCINSAQCLNENHQDENANEKLDIRDINPYLLGMPAYAIRGLLTSRAYEIEDEIKHGAMKPFKKIIHATVGCCHGGGGQNPLTFVRQLLAAITCPSLLENDLFPKDINEKAKSFLESIPGGSIGSYSATNGTPLIRQLAAKYIEDRDGIKTNWKNIYLANGASGAIFGLINLLNNPRKDKKIGILTPVPEYPLYSSILKALGMVNIEYYLEEEKQWNINVEELQRKVDTLSSKCTIKAIVVINPGNPTGQVLTKANIQEIVEFCNKNGLMIIADEVYQLNIHNADMEFHSFKKVIHDLNLVPNNITLASLMSASKGYLGECGLRGGYVELDNMDADVQKTFEKSLSLHLCPTTYGQAALYCLFSRPKEGELSYKLFEMETTELANQWKQKAKMAYETFNNMEGFSCTRIDGSLYAFAKVTFPEGVLKTANERNEEPDYMYAKELLETTGISLVAGSGFGQKSGTYHIRITLLLQINVMEELLEILKDFHKKFLARYNEQA